MASDTTPQDRLRARIGTNLTQLGNIPEAKQSETGRAMAGALNNVLGWLAEPGITWAALTERAARELQAAITAHGVSVKAEDEDFAAYARADALLAVQSWMAELGGS